MNPEIPGSREETETKITALLLGELSPDGAEAVRAAMAADPKLAALHERLKRTVELVKAASEPANQTAEQPAPLKLADERREKLLAQFKTVRPKGFAKTRQRQPSWFVPLAAAAVLLVMGALAVVFMSMNPRQALLSFLPGSAVSPETSVDYSEQPQNLDLYSRGDGDLRFTAPGTVRFYGDLEAGNDKEIRRNLTRQESASKSYGTIFNQSSSDISVTPSLDQRRGALAASDKAGGAVAGEAEGRTPNVSLKVAPSASRLARKRVETEELKKGVAELSKSPTGGVTTRGRAESETLERLVETRGKIEEQVGRELGQQAAERRPRVIRDQLLANSAIQGTSKPADAPSPPPEPAAGAPIVPMAPPAQFSLGLADQSGPAQAGFGGGGGAGGFGGYAPQLKTENYSYGLPAAGTERWYENRAGQAEINGRAPQDGEDVPALGDVPVLGKFFRSEQAGRKEARASGNIVLPDVAAGDAVTGQPATVFFDSAPEAPVALEADRKVIAGGEFEYTRSLSSAASPGEMPPGLVTANGPVAEEGVIAGQSQLHTNAAGYWAHSSNEAEMFRRRSGLARGNVVTPAPQGQAAAAGVPVAPEPELLKQKIDQLAAGRLAAPTATPAQSSSSTTLEPREPEKAAAKPATPPPVPQPEIQTAENPYSTFSLNVADVSFKLAAASLDNGQMPDPGAIRSEEFINAFDYRDPEAAPDAPFAFAWERARYPFAHNRDLLRFSIKTAVQGRSPNTPLNLVLLLDNSGSMERADRVSTRQESIKVLANQLQEQDKLSVVTFARNAQLRLDGARGQAAGQAAEEVAKLTPEGGTNLEEAMRLGYETAYRNYVPGGVNRVILMTDGAANLGSTDAEALKPLVEHNRRQGVALDCFGIGWEGYNDEMLEVLARNGDGRYGFVNSPEEATGEFAAKLAGALQVAASDVKVQVEFNAERVSVYRQVGYAKHQLTKEQFRDNTVDAAEIAAAESGNALYVIETKSEGKGPLATVRVRYKNPATGDYSENEWSVPYAGTATPLDQASPAIKLAGTAAAFSELLAGNPYAGEVTTDRLLGLMTGVKETFGADPRPAQLERMLRQAKNISGR